MIDRQYILEADGDRFVLRVEPPLIGLFESRAFDSYRTARGTASGLRLSYRGTVVDLTAPEGGAK